MRSRPGLRLSHWPPSPRPGEPLDVTIMLDVGSPTPIDGIQVELRVDERWNFFRPADGNPALRNLEAPSEYVLPPCRLARFVATLPGGMLEPGEWRHQMRFDLPADLPSSHRGVRIALVYVVAVHVAIPWWPDRRGEFSIAVAAAPAADPPTEPIVVSTDPSAGDASAPQLEVSLSSVAVAAGSELRGAFALTNVVPGKVRRVVGVLECVDQGPTMGAVARECRFVLCEGPPVDGEPHRFHLRVPDDWEPSWSGRCCRSRTRFLVIADLSLQRDVVVPVDIEVMRAPTVDDGAVEERHRGDPHGTSGPATAPAVGTERLRELWARCALRAGLVFDDAHLRITGELGAVSLRIAFSDEARGRGEPRATLTWPLLGMQLRVTSDAAPDDDVVPVPANILTPVRPGSDVMAAGRFAVQVAALFGDRLHAELASDNFRSFLLDDSGGTLEAGDVGGSEHHFDLFVASVRIVAAEIDAARLRIPPPPPMASYAEQWRAYAGATDGWLETGRMWVHDATLGRDRFEIGTRWSVDQPEATVVWVPLQRALDSRPTVEELAARSPTAAAALRRLDHSRLLLTPGWGALQAELPAPLADPRDAEPTLRALIDLARSLDDEPASGPYR